MRLDHIFDVQGFDDDRKIAVATIYLTKYALTWWDNKNKTIFPWHPIRSMNELKARFRLRWVPPHFVKDLHQRLQSLTQGKISVEGYHRDVE
jgi:hypothetical protein